METSNATLSRSLTEFGNSKCDVTLNFTNVTESVIIDQFFYSQSTRILATYILPLILSFGFLGNVAFLFTLVRVQSMRTITNAYLANLSAADLCFVIFVWFRYIWTFTNSPYVFTNTFKEDAGCILMDFVAYFAYFASNSLVNLVSYERYLAICHPLKHNAFKTKARTIKMITGMWLVAFLVAATVAPRTRKSLRYCVLWPDRQFYSSVPTVLYHCLSLPDAYRLYSSILQIITFITTFSINVVLYTLIIWTLKKRQIINGDISLQQSQMQKVNDQVTRMLVFNAITFFLCLTPFQVYWIESVITALSDGKIDILTRDQSSIVYWTGCACNCINASINPLIYNVVSARYRNALAQSLKCFRRKN